MSRRAVYFDFCDTLVNFQTADSYVDFVRDKRASNRMIFLEKCYLLLNKLQFFRILNKIFPTASIEKRFKLFQLKGVYFKELDQLAFQFYNQVVKHNFIHSLLEKLEEHKIHGDRVEVVSGGYSIYLKYFCEDFGIEKLHCSNIGFNRLGICSGKIKGLDCLYGNKVRILEEENKSRTLEKVSIAYSDSITDLPLLNWVTQGFVVSKGKSQDWAHKKGFNQIIW